MPVVEVLARVSRQARAHHNIFLSQTIREAEIVLGAHDTLTGMGYSVFCDWVDAPEAGHREVTAADAAFVRAVMGACDSLLFLDTHGAIQSRWMC